MWSVLEPLVNKSTFSYGARRGASAALQLVKSDKLSHRLQDLLTADPRTNTIIALCFLDTPKATSN
jgi:hypothetical protein